MKSLIDKIMVWGYFSANNNQEQCHICCNTNTDKVLWELRWGWEGSLGRWEGGGSDIYTI